MVSPEILILPWRTEPQFYRNISTDDSNEHTLSAEGQIKAAVTKIVRKRKGGTRRYANVAHIVLYVKRGIKNMPSHFYPAYNFHNNPNSYRKCQSTSGVF
jgi:hypothetical protein